jgi:hypothetical protein
MSIDDLLTHHWHIVAYVIATLLHELHMYMISYTTNCVCYNSFNLFNNTHIIEICLSCKWPIQLKNLSCKISCKTPYLIIVAPSIRDFESKKKSCQF